MIDGDALELRMVFARLETTAVDVGLLNSDVARILGLQPGAWPVPIVEQWSPIEVRQERRIRELYELCRMLMDAFGADAPMWLRRADLGVGTTPLEFLASRPGSLGWLRRALLGALAAMEVGPALAATAALLRAAQLVECPGECVSRGVEPERIVIGAAFDDTALLGPIAAGGLHGHTDDG